MTLFWTPRFQGPLIKNNVTGFLIRGGGGRVFKQVGWINYNNWVGILAVAKNIKDPGDFY